MSAPLPWTELDDRRQRAREDYHDNGGAPDARGEYAPIEMAIKTATRVQITPEIERAAYTELAAEGPGRHHAAVRRALRAAFESAGFEVVE